MSNTENDVKEVLNWNQWHWNRFVEELESRFIPGQKHLNINSFFNMPISWFEEPSHKRARFSLLWETYFWLLVITPLRNMRWFWKAHIKYRGIGYFSVKLTYVFKGTKYFCSNNLPQHDCVGIYFPRQVDTALWRSYLPFQITRDVAKGGPRGPCPPPLSGKIK